MLVTDRMVAQIERLGIDRKPEEVCGLVFADSRVLELLNETEEDRSCNWSFGPMNSVVRQIREAGIADFMFESAYLVWHTHPGGLIGPSSEDLRYRVKGVDYLVVTLTDAGPVPVRY